jgi:hypothetical protein
MVIQVGNKMTEHPLLCTSQVVQNILAGRQTQDRRPMRKQPTRVVSDWTENAESGEIVIYNDWPHKLTVSRGRNKRDLGELTPTPLKSPFGKPGDVLWVRETWCKDACEVMHYRADCLGTHTEHGYKIIWKPSIHMPRWACRLFLTVKRVWVERVQSISEANDWVFACEFEVRKD